MKMKETTTKLEDDDDYDERMCEAARLSRESCRLALWREKMSRLDSQRKNTSANSVPRESVPLMLELFPL